MKICISFVIFLLVWTGFRFSDICLHKLQRLSDEQLIDLAFIELLNKKVPPQIAPSVDGRSLRLSNPECCIVRRFDGALTGEQWGWRMIGVTRIEIVLIYPVDRNGSKNVLYTSYLSSNACGNMIRLAGTIED